MNIKRVNPSGFCKGVVHAINLCKQARLKNPDKDIYVLGMIVHNKFVTKALEYYNIKTLIGDNKEELLNSIDHGIVIFSAHGISQKYIDLALKKGLEYIDASCEDVLVTQNNIKEYLKLGYTILYIGKSNHPEANAILDLSDSVYLVSNKKDLMNLKLDKNVKVYVTNQTTMSIFEVAFLFEEIKTIFPNCVIEEEICHATSKRQEAILDLKDCDLLYVIGDPNSNNTTKLMEIAKSRNIQKVIKIETCLEIKESDLVGVENIYVTAGASSPNYLTKQVLEVLETYKVCGEIIYPDMDYQKMI